MISFKNLYDIGQTIYHITKESDEGIILDISYEHSSKSVKYLVTFGRHQEDTVWCMEMELSDSKRY